ncbi:MAG: glycosyltransferase [Methanosarcina sp.]
MKGVVYMSNLLKVSVVVCTYSHERYFDTIETIESLVKQSYQNIEIILIVDRNVNLFKDFNTSDYLISLNNFKIGISNLAGLSNARNKGVELSAGDIISFIDDDAIADINWVSNLVACYKDSKIIGVGGPMKPLWITGIARWIPEEFYWTMGCSYKSQRTEPHYVRSNFGSNMSFRRIAFEKVGKFDDKFGLIDSNMKTGEETQFSIRVLNHFEEFKIIFTPEAIVYHKIYAFRKSLLFLIKRCYSYGYAIANIGQSKSKLDKKLESTENNFLKYLFFVSFVERLKNIIFLRNLSISISHIFSLFILTIAVGIGFVHKKFGYQ